MLTPAAQRSLAKLPDAELGRLYPRLLALGDAPWPRGTRKLSGRDSTYRIRVGNYRILYRVEDLVVRVLDIGHRRDVYR